MADYFKCILCSNFFEKSSIKKIFLSHNRLIKYFGLIIYSTRNLDIFYPNHVHWSKQFDYFAVFLFFLYIKICSRLCVHVCVCVCASICKSPQRLLNAGTQKVGKGTKKREKIHRGARDHFRRIRFIISRVIN